MIPGSGKTTQDLRDIGRDTLHTGGLWEFGILGICGVIGCKVSVGSSNGLVLMRNEKGGSEILPTVLIFFLAMRLECTCDTEVAFHGC